MTFTGIGDEGGGFLFPADATQNLLPQDGEVNYYGPILSVERAGEFLAAFLATVPWKNDEAFLFGKHHITARKVAWYGDASFTYAYSGTAKTALPWFPKLQELKDLVEDRSGCRYNACLLNLYHNGGEGMGWHSDNEATLVPGAAIASVSLGAKRRFCFKHRQQPDMKAEVLLEHGSLLVMRGSTQQHWLHSIPKAAAIKDLRVNLTFRQFR